MLSSGDIVWNVIHWNVIITIKICVNIPKCIGNCGSLGFYNMVTVVAKLVPEPMRVGVLAVPVF